MGDFMGLLEELQQKYPPIHDALHGECLIIAADKFRNEWNDELRQQGCRIVQGNLGLHAMVFVSLPTKSTVSTASTESTEPTVAQPWLGKPWTQDEDKEIIKGVTLGQTDAEIAKRLPGRTEVATKQRRKRLEKHGAFQPKKPKRGRPPGKTMSTPAPDEKPYAVVPGQGRVELDIVAEGKSHPPSPVPAPTSQPRTQSFTIHTTLTVNLNVDCNDASSVANALKLLQEARRI